MERTRSSAPSGPPEGIEELKNAIALLLESKPKDPVQFMASHFKTLATQSYKSNIEQSYDLIKSSALHEAKFMDMLSVAFNKLVENRKGASKRVAMGGELMELVTMLCKDLPVDMKATILKALGNKNENDFITFKEFASAVKTCIAYGDYLTHAELLFDMCGEDGSGTAYLDTILSAFQEMGVEIMDRSSESGASQYESTALKIIMEIEPSTVSMLEREATVFSIGRSGGRMKQIEASLRSSATDDGKVMYGEFLKCLVAFTQADASHLIA